MNLRICICECNEQLIYFFLKAIFFTLIDSSDYFVHKNIEAR